MARPASNTPEQHPNSPAQEDFSAPTFSLALAGILFDMDGTLIDSTAAIVKLWERVGKEYNIDPATILATSHGRRSIDVFAHIDPPRATWDHVRALEAQVPQQYGATATEIPGARNLLTSLDDAGARWAIVTSGTSPLVNGWLRVLKLSAPKRMVTAEDVARGKPDPECYRLGRRRMGGASRPEPCLVFEDAPAGIRAGKAAGCLVIAVATTHAVPELRAAGADWIIKDLRSVSLVGVDRRTGLVTVNVEGALL